MLSERELSAAIGATAYGPDGHKIGTVEHFFTDDRTGAPTWVAVSTGLFGTRRSVVPAAEATFDGDGLRLPVTRDAVRNAPHVSDEHLDPDAEELLRRHYSGESAPAEGGAVEGRAAEGGAVGGGARDAGSPDAGSSDAGTAAAPEARAGTAQAAAAAPTGAGPDERTERVDPTAHASDTVRVEESGRAGDTVRVAEVAPAGAGSAGAGPAEAGAVETGSAGTRGGGATAGAGDNAMTRSEEQLRVGTERVATTRARLVKYVVTEEVTLTVPIRREEIRVEQVPVDAPDPAPRESLAPDEVPAGGPSSGLPEEIVLHAERPVVTVEVVPVERVRLRTDVVTGQEQVTEQVQREQVVVDQDPPRGRVE
ncbi:YsnF/AvaK domain-containing protein [Geodermatophilus sp. SYSU D00965]